MTAFSVGGSSGSVEGTTPSATRSPASSASAKTSRSAADSSDRSPLRPRAPAPRTRLHGVPGAHEWTQGSVPADSSTHESASDASGGWTTRCLPNPEAVGIAPASTAVNDGSSTCTTTCSASTRRRTSARWLVTPSASAWASSRRAPWSASTLSPRGFSTVAARVHGPVTWTLRTPRKSWACSSSRSRSCARRDRARRWSTPGASVSRQPAGCRSNPRSVMMPSVRPTMPATTPRPGSSGR